MLKEILLYILHNKKWWLFPVILVLLLISLFIIFANSAVAPFIYSLF